MKVKDKHPAVLVKDAILARSGIYRYSREDLRGMKLVPREEKAEYKVYRPPGVLIGAKDKFPFAVVTKEHTASDTSPDNFRQQADGVVGDRIEVVALEDGHIALKGRIAFYTRDAADYFESGNRETSAQYDMRLAESRDPEGDGYDYMMTDIESVNGVAITARGRGGKNVRVLDSVAAAAIDKAIGGNEMGGFLSFLGIGKAKDTGFKFSDVLFGGIAKVKAFDGADAACIEGAVGEIMSHVSPLGGSEAKDILAGAVSDCLKNADAVLSRKDDVAKKIDELYAKCRDADAEAVKRVLDAGEEPDKDKGKDPDKDKDKDPDKDKDKDKDKGAAAKDSGAVIAAAVDKAFDKFSEGLDAKIDAAMKRVLGEGVGPKPPAPAGAVVGAADGLDNNDDASYLVRGVFGSR
jgi:hypothetical protein